MLDPLSVAGLALAVIDELLTLGEKTAEVVADIRSFDDATKGVHEKIKHETWKTAALKRILFVQSKVYGGSALIDQFDEDAQDQIHCNLVELVNVLEGALKLLQNLPTERSSNVGSLEKLSLTDNAPSYPLSHSPGTGASPTPHVYVARAKTNKSPFQIIRWSLRTKKQAIEIVKHFSELNARLMEKVQFLSLASEVGVQFHHLEHLEQNVDSISLGFNDDASLKLVASDVHKIHESCELDASFDNILRQGQPIEDRYAICEWDGTPFLQEKCMYVLGSDPDLNAQTRNRINALAKLLQQPKEQLFCILPCQGWRYLRSTERIMYLFQVPAQTEPHPQSLLKLLSEPASQPSLGIKFKIAYSLARSIARLHMVKWVWVQDAHSWNHHQIIIQQVHESLRSENILFFPKASDSVPNVASRDSKIDTISHALDLKTPWIFGFEFSRPDTYFSHGYIDICPDRDVYRHPERQGQPLTTFKKIHDIYALGVLLLGIGIWRPAITLERNRFAYAKDPYSIQTHLMKHAQKHLENFMGERYRDMTLKCLSGNFGISEDTREDLKLQQAFRSQVVDVLKRSAENV